ncbi:MAG: DNA polymerase III subunit alpha, partial [Acidimicrobiia bacterium]
FAHLHLHTEFSMLDGAARVKDVVAAAAADGQPAIAITDHGVLYGVVDFYKAARAVGVNPIIGIEAYVVDGSRFDRPRGNENVRHHMTLLAVNQTGYQNLMKLSSRAYLDGYYYKPRMDSELLAAHAEGIVATSGCLGGPVARRLAPDASREDGQAGAVRDFDAALKAAGHYQDIFGRDNFYIEIQDHGLEAQRRIMPDLLDISHRIGAPLVATNDAHYTRRDEAASHDVLLCIQTGSNKDDQNRLRFESDDFYLKSAAEMRATFPNDRYPGACDNTLLIAERAKVDLDFGRILLPQFPVPDVFTEQTYLEHLVMTGAKQRYGDLLPTVVTERIASELAVIGDMGFPAYFLIVWDLIRYARERGIRVGPGRGSAAGSIVAYSLRITDLDPIEHGLIFERFLNPGRRQLPDIDMDFDERYRSDVIRYAAEKYGSDHVAQIVTFSTIKGKQALRDAARVLGHPYSIGDRLAKAMPPAILGKEATLDQCLTPPEPDADSEIKDWYSNASELRELYRSDTVLKEVVEVARGLEGLRRQDSIHAAAVVISPTPLIDLVPVQRKGEDAEIVTQYEMYGIEALGLLKMDFLGLRNLSIIERTLELIKEGEGIEVDIDGIPLDDQAAYELIRRGDTVGVFQLEGSGLRSLIRALQPDQFEDLIALVSLYRPGPLGQNMHTAYADRKNGRAKVEFPHPATEPVLARSYGIIVYQEQVLQIAQAVAGYTMSEAEDLRRAMGKKVKWAMQAQREKFVAGCVAQGYTPEVGANLFDTIEPFAGYGFARSHAACYGYVAYQTAWLKAHYPAEYMAALLTATKRDKERTAVYLAECRAMGVEVLVPDVNQSQMDFSVHEGKIRFGLSAVRNVGEGVVEKIVASRASHGPFTDFHDFANRVDPLVLNKRTVESLVKAGAFDGVGHPRKALLLQFESLLEATLERRRNEEMGQYSLFGQDSVEAEQTHPEIVGDEWPQKLKLAFEKEMLGLYVSDHPLLAIGPTLQAMAQPISGLLEQKDRTNIAIGGLVGSITRRFTKKGELMLFFQLEDLEASVEVVAFPGVVNESGSLVVEDAVLTVRGHLDHRGDDVKVIAREIAELNIRPELEVRLEVPARRLSSDLVAKLKDILSHHPGSAPVFLHMVSDNKHKVLRLSDSHRVEPRSALYAELRELLGQGAVI